MQLGLLLSLSLVLQPETILQSQTRLPTLAVVSVLPRTDQTTGCAVTLRNNHTRSAVAWVIESLPYHDLGATTDNVLAPGAKIAPSTDTAVLFPCQVGELPALEVMAVIYDDNTVGGDPKAIASRIIPHRRSLADGLADLAELLRAARPPRGIEGASAQLSALIRQSSSSKLTGRAREEAATILGRVIGKGGVASDFSALAEAVRGEMLSAVQLLRATAQ